MTTRGDSSVSVHASDIAGANTSPNMCLGSAHDTCTDTHLVETTAEKETRHVHFAEWLVRVFGNERLRAGTGVVDVAGGKGALYPALCSTLVPANGGASAEGDTAAITTTAATVGAVPLAPPWPLKELRYTLIEPAHSSMPAVLRSAVTDRCDRSSSTKSDKTFILHDTPHTAPVRVVGGSEAAAETALSEPVLHLPLLFGPTLWTR